MSLVKMFLIGYLFVIKSERRLVNEIALNIAYRGFYGFSITDRIPDHSTFSKNRISRWKESNLFAVARAMLVAIYHMLKNAESFKDLGADYYFTLDAERIKNKHIASLKRLGYTVSLYLSV